MNILCRDHCWFRVGLDEFQFRHQWQIVAPLVDNFGSDLLHLGEAYGRYRMRHSNTNAVGIFHGECAPELFRACEIVARPCCIVCTDIVGLTLETDAECPFSRAPKFLDKCAAGRYSSEQQSGVDCCSAGPAKDFVGTLLFQMTKIGMREFMSDDEGKLRVGARYPQDARMDDDYVAGREGIRR